MEGEEKDKAQQSRYSYFQATRPGNTVTLTCSGVLPSYFSSIVWFMESLMVAAFLRITRQSVYCIGQAGLLAGRFASLASKLAG